MSVPLLGPLPSPTDRRARAELTDRRFSILAAGAFVAAAAILVFSGRDLSFFHDEWAIITSRSLTLDGVMRPHNEHPSILLVLAFRGLVETVGLGSYWPYLIVEWLTHAAVVVLIYVMLRESAGLRIAASVALIFAVLGSGFENILWAFQMGANGSLALGLAAIWLAPRRPVLSALLLTLSVMTQGIGLAFIAGAGVHLALTRPRSTLWLAVPVVVFGVWYLIYGRSAVSSVHQPSIDGVAPYVAYGIIAAAGGVLGTRSVAVGLLVVLAVALALLVSRQRIPPLHWGLLASVVAFLCLAGLVRAQDGYEQAAQSRYIYVAAPALMIVGATILGGVRLQAMRLVAPTLLALALAGNIGLLVMGHADRLARERCEASMDPAIRGIPGSPC